MTNSQPFQRAKLSANAADVLLLLPLMGKLMITSKHGGATHERIGEVERVDKHAGLLVVSGSAHNSRIDPTAIATVTVDRTSVMGGQPYPRLDFIRPDGDVIFSVVGFAGAEPFDAAIADLGAGEELPPAEKAAPPERPEVLPTDPGAVPFKAAIANGVKVSIRFAKPGFDQQWDGVVETIKPAMGFNNIMREDFHLHLRANAVEAWQEAEQADLISLAAISATDGAIGLSIVGPADAFAEKAEA